MSSLRTKERKEVSLSSRFSPQFWNDADKRCGAVKEIRRRYAALKEDVGADSSQKDILCQRAVFVAVQLESMEIAAAEQGKFDAGVYTQSVNCLLGLLKALGLERKIKAAGGLHEYVKERRK